ncbi:hypothetical protein [Paraburkholderia azotifigens]|uniref:GIY-YIG nuclease family protein n=2 Tax=Paraburkholderia azotifigens TaxID=2057004 RepID=A0A5C6VE58_9BURK|nr:hypothetical protein [Paraburkholderia azotifigens]TXC83633.1 hypothetical protein FRZ40_24945 [Paraburkholderia azotifigens]
MTSMPIWFSQLTWRAPPIPVTHFVANLVKRDVIPLGAGIYIFSTNDQPLSAGNVLYVGKADGARQTLQRRLDVYFRRFARPGGKPSRHAGLELLNKMYREAPNALYVRWAGCVVAREIEGELIWIFDPVCNSKDEHRSGYDEDTLIPAEYLY